MDITSVGIRSDLYKRRLFVPLRQIEQFFFFGFYRSRNEMQLVKDPSVTSSLFRSFRHFAATMSGRKIKLQSSDGDTFDVDVEIAKQSATIKTMLEGKDERR